MSTEPVAVGVSQRAVAAIDEAVAKIEEIVGPGSLLARKISILETYNNVAEEISKSRELIELHRLLRKEESALRRDAHWMVKYSRLFRELLAAEAKLDTVRSKILEFLNQRLAEFRPDLKLNATDPHISEGIAKLVNEWVKTAEGLLLETVTKYKRWRWRRLVLDVWNKTVFVICIAGVGFEIFSEHLREFIAKHSSALSGFLQRYWPSSSSFAMHAAIIAAFIIPVTVHVLFIHPRLEKRLLNAQRKDFSKSLDQIYINHMKILFQIAVMEHSIWSHVVKKDENAN